MTVDPVVSDRPDGPGLRAFDPIEKSYEELHTPEPVDPTPTGTGRFHFPVDVAVAIETPVVRTPYRVDVWIRDCDGDLLADTASPGDASVPAGSYNVELSATGVKLYLAVEGPVVARGHDDGTEIRFDGERRVEVGIRSYHERPAGSVTVTDDPADVMAGLSLFGSALKTTSPERTFPTLRGHPPTLEPGDRFEADDDLEPPDTGVRIEVPPEREFVFPVTSLAYFLGATVRPGDRPRLVVGDRSYSLDGPAGFPGTVRRVLEQTFLFDCACRTEGLYTVRLAERERLEAALDREFDFAALYDRPLAERVNRYLAVPYDRIADVVPRWPLTADVEPTAGNAAALPFVADRLGVVRCDVDGPTLELPRQPAGLDDFYRLPDRDDRDGRGRPTGRDGDGQAPCRGWSGGVPDDDGTERDRPARADGGTAAARDAGVPAPVEVVRPPPADSLEHLWLADGVPLGACKATLDAFRRQVDRTPDVTQEITVAVVCNDDAMREEGVVGDVYGDREHVAVDVRTHEDLARDELRDVLASPVDFLHYVGHVDDRGLACDGGFLDVRGMDRVGVEAFLLNGCRSFAQGRALVDAGAVAGIVTLDVVSNAAATRIGRTVADVLRAGHSLGTAARLAAETRESGFQYSIVGMGTNQIIDTVSGTPAICKLDEGIADEYHTEIVCLPSKNADLGATFYPLIKSEIRYLNSGTTFSGSLSPHQLRQLLNEEYLAIWTKDGEIISPRTLLE